MGNVVECVDLVITNVMNLDLLRPIAPQEIKDAVFEMGALKAPGPDGFQGIFYQHFGRFRALLLSLWGEMINPAT